MSFKLIIACEPGWETVVFMLIIACEPGWEAVRLKSDASAFSLSEH